jgi:Ca2+-binding EF-hand superfamily protein
MVRMSLRSAIASRPNWVLGIVAGLALIPWLAVAEAGKDQEPKAKFEVPAADDMQDIVYFGPTRPVLIRIYTQIDGKPFETPWYEYLAALFGFLDRNGDGVLNENEAALAPTPQQLLQLMGGNLSLTPRADEFNFKDLDTNKDGKVTFQELADSYRRNGAGPVQVAGGAGPNGGQDPLTDALFRHLAADKDKLTKEELQAAAQVLMKLDADDDEMVSAAELGVNRGGGPAMRQPQVLGQPPQPPALGPPPDDSPLFAVVPDGSPKRINQRRLVAQKIIAHYDKNGDKKLSRDEIGFDKATFDRLDRNKDGVLDAKELLLFLNPPADIEFTVRLGLMGPKEAPAELATPNGKPAPLASAVTRWANGTLTFAHAGAQIELRRTAGAASNMAGNRQQIIQQFRAADKENRGFLNIKQLDNQQLQFLKVAFPLADRNGDGKLTEEELDDYLEMQSKAVNCALVVTIADRGQSLFDLLDANRDGRLGLRELRTAWERVKPYAKDGVLTRKDLPHQFRVLLSRGPAVQGDAPRTTLTGPLWFRLMDRNGDGDISQREFLGSRADFKRLDLDGDGLISLEEAIKADAGYRRKK